MNQTGTLNKFRTTKGTNWQFSNKTTNIGVNSLIRLNRQRRFTRLDSTNNTSIFICAIKTQFCFGVFFLGRQFCTGIFLTFSLPVCLPAFQETIHVLHKIHNLFFCKLMLHLRIQQRMLMGFGTSAWRHRINKFNKSNHP